MQSLVVIMLFFGLGIFLGYLLRHKRRIFHHIDSLSMVAVYALLFVLGAQLGANTELLRQLPLFGGIALVVAISCSLGSVFCLWLAARMLPTLQFDGAQEAAKLQRASASSPFTGTLCILCFFAAGILLAYLALVPWWLMHTALAEYAICVLVFVVGIGLGGAIEAFSVVTSMKLRILYVPALTIIGTFLGALLSTCFVSLSVQEALCVGAGFGYYSLSSILISEAGFPALASVALLANILREIFAIVCAQLMVRFAGPLAPIGMAGATAMDTCLPIIAQFSGERYVIIAVFSGMVLTCAAPVVVTLLINW